MASGMLFFRDAVSDGAPNPTGDTLATVAIVFAVVCTVLVAARLATRIFINKMTGWDDYFLIFGLVLAIGMAVCFNMEVHFGMGMHNKGVGAKNKIMAFKWLFAAQFLYKIANGVVKISILLLYLRIFPGKGFRLASFIIMGIIVAYCIAAAAASIWQCKPISKAWNKSEEGKCINIGAVWYANSVLTIAADVAIIVLPMNQIVRLQLPRAQKVGLGILFSLGLFVIACTVVRMVSLGPSISAKDSTYYQAKSNSWTFLEIDVAIICASLPILKAPIARLFPKIFGTTLNKSSFGTANGYNHGTAKQYGQHSMASANHHHSDWTNSSHLRNSSTTSNMGGGGGRHHPKLDNASDEELMLDDMNIIRKTTDIKFQYEETDLSDGRKSREDEEKGFPLPHSIPPVLRRN